MDGYISVREVEKALRKVRKASLAEGLRRGRAQAAGLLENAGHLNGSLPIIVKALRGSWDEGEHPRNHGQFAKKGEGEAGVSDRAPTKKIGDDTTVKDSPKSKHFEHPTKEWKTVGELKTQADSWAKRILENVKGIGKAVLRKARDKVLKAYTKLERRYGKVYARLAVAAGLCALPVPLPMASMMAAAPIVAVAELHRQLASASLGDPHDKSAEGQDHHVGAESVIKSLAKWFVKKTVGHYLPQEDTSRVVKAFVDQRELDLIEAGAWEPPTRTRIVKAKKDAAGHEHRGKGPGGGQFVSQGGGGSSGKEGKNKAEKSGGKQESRDSKAVGAALKKIDKAPAHKPKKDDPSAPRPGVQQRGEMMATPLPVNGSEEVHEAVHKVLSNPHVQRTTEEVPIKDITARQSGVSKATLKHFVAKGDRNEKDHELPTIVETEHGMMLHDGTHRVSADQLAGKETVKAAVYRLPPEQGGKTKKGKEGKEGKGPSTKPKAPPMSEKALRAKAAHKLVDKTIQRYAEEHNEPKFAKAIGGLSFKDNEPVDVVVGAGGVVKHGIELKTMVSNKANKITMKRSAMERKAQWEKDNKATFHTVVIDDSAVFNANGEGDHDLSKRKMFYRRGFGSFRVGTMHPVKNVKELKALLDMPDNALPQAARRAG